jgi:hypothetical protein
VRLRAGTGMSQPQAKERPPGLAAAPPQACSQCRWIHMCNCRPLHFGASHVAPTPFCSCTLTARGHHRVVSAINSWPNSCLQHAVPASGAWILWVLVQCPSSMDSVFALLHLQPGAWPSLSRPVSSTPPPAAAAPQGAWGRPPPPTAASPQGAWGAVPPPAAAAPQGAWGRRPPPTAASPEGAVPPPAAAAPQGAWGRPPPPAAAPAASPQPRPATQSWGGVGASRLAMLTAHAGIAGMRTLSMAAKQGPDVVSCPPTNMLECAPLVYQ